MKEIELYTTIDGKCPYKIWYKTLSIEYRLRVNKRIERMVDGNFGDWKRL